MRSATSWPARNLRVHSCALLAFPASSHPEGFPLATGQGLRRCPAIRGAGNGDQFLGLKQIFSAPGLCLDLLILPFQTLPEKALRKFLGSLGFVNWVQMIGGREAEKPNKMDYTEELRKNKTTWNGKGPFAERIGVDRRFWVKALVQKVSP